MKVGIVGWRGMVGSVLLERMRAERDFEALTPVFFSSSQAGAAGPEIGRALPPLGDAHDLAALAALPVIVSCQGGDYTSAVHPRLRAGGWRGYWIDAASTLRMQPDAAIILDPVNRPVIERALAAADEVAHAATADVLGHERALPVCGEGDVLLIATAGAYGHAMSSRYNLREPAEELVLAGGTGAQ